MVSTIRSAPPLIITYGAGSSPNLVAWDYAGHRVGTAVISSAVTGVGCAFAPDGSKVFLGNGRILNSAGTQLADVAALNLGAPGEAGCSQPGINGAYFLGGPIWADDSDHVCGFLGSSPPGHGTHLVEVSAAGLSRTVSILPSGGQLLACSPGADRVIVGQSSGSDPGSYRSNIVVMRLSTGATIATYSVAGDLGTATHDGRLIAMSGPTGITVYNAETGHAVAHVVRQGDLRSRPGVPDLGYADMFSWDGTWLLVVADAANGAFHPAWVVALANNRNVLTDAASLGSPWLSFYDNGVTPTLQGPMFFLPGRNATAANASSYYLLDRSGGLRLLQ